MQDAIVEANGSWVPPVHFGTLAAFSVPSSLAGSTDQMNSTTWLMNAAAHLSDELGQHLWHGLEIKIETVSCTVSL